MPSGAVRSEASRGERYPGAWRRSEGGKMETKNFRYGVLFAVDRPGLIGVSLAARFTFPGPSVLSRPANANFGGEQTNRKPCAQQAD